VTTDPKAILIAGSIAAVTALVITGVILADSPARGAADPAPVVSAARAVEVAPPVPSTITRDGIYVAGRQIKTGTYTAPGGSFCYWARLKYTPYGTQLRLVSSYDPDRQVATIIAGDVFQTAGCGSWEPVR